MTTFDEHILKWVEHLVSFEKYIKNTDDDEIHNILDTLVLPSNTEDIDSRVNINMALQSINDFHVFRDILNKDASIFFNTFLAVVQWHTDVPNRGFIIWYHVIRGRGYSLISNKTKKRITFNKEYLNNIQLFHSIISHNERIN